MKGLLSILFALATTFVFTHQPTPLADDPFRARVETVLPLLEAHVVAGSDKDRDDRAECARDALVRTTDIDAIEAYLFEGKSTANDRLAEPLASGMKAARACVTCTEQIVGCADAARAFTRVENRLGWARVPGES